MKTRLTWLAVAMGVHLSQTVAAYDTATHARMTRSAVLQSQLGTSNLLGELGLPQGATTPLGSVYLEVLPDPGAQANTRLSYPFDWAKGVMPGVEPTPDAPGNEQLPTLPEGWLMRGTIREDDGGISLGQMNPHDDPTGSIHRFCNHFYDPVYNRKLSYAGCMGDDLTSAPAWAMGVPGLANPPGGIARPAPLSPSNTDRRNHYTIQDAREAMWRALTLKQFRDRSGALQIDPATRTPTTPGGKLLAAPPPRNPALRPFASFDQQRPYSIDPVRAQRQYRDAYWATTFFSLGSVLHLNQDMAQPQHTRVEAHPTLAPKAFERYIEARALSDWRPQRYSSRLVGGGVYVNKPFPTQPLRFEPPAPLVWSPPTFANLSDYWSTAGDGDVASGQGLGDYSSSRFFSWGHNLGEGDGTPTYRLPSNNPADYQPVTAPDALGFRHFYLDGVVKDPLDRTDTVLHLTRLSPIAAMKVENGLGPTLGDGRALSYTLDTTVYDDYARLLLPRAVTYSAGLINHFFRGRMRISPPDSGIYGIVDHSRFAPTAASGNFRTDVERGFLGFDKIRLKLANITAAITPPGGTPIAQDMPDGVLVAVLKFHRNLCYDDLLANWPATATQALACRSPEAEIVVSAPLANQSVPAPGAPTPDGIELAFDFSGQELPINAWDVVLQVVYRGQLGQEPDAVVVATQDISEPAFIGFINTTDKVVLNGAFYTPATINANQALFSQVHPDCKQALPAGGYALRERCHAFDDAFSFTAGTSNVTISANGSAAIPPRRFARLAVLSDTASGVRLNWPVEAVNCHVFLSNPVVTRPYRAELSAANVWTAGSPFALRGIKNWNWEFCYADVGAADTLPQNVPLQTLDNLLSAEEIAPVPLSILNW